MHLAQDENDEWHRPVFILGWVACIPKGTYRPKNCRFYHFAQCMFLQDTVANWCTWLIWVLCHNCIQSLPTITLSFRLSLSFAVLASGGWQEFENPWSKRVSWWVLILVFLLDLLQWSPSGELPLWTLSGGCPEGQAGAWSQEDQPALWLPAFLGKWHRKGFLLLHLLKSLIWYSVLSCLLLFDQSPSLLYTNWVQFAHDKNV